MMVLGSKEYKLQWISRMCEALWHRLATLSLLSKLRMVLCVPHMFYTAFRKRYECSFWGSNDCMTSYRAYFLVLCVVVGRRCRTSVADDDFGFD